jgi:hypothetical protein
LWLAMRRSFSLISPLSVNPLHGSQKHPRGRKKTAISKVSFEYHVADFFDWQGEIHKEFVLE